MEQATECAALKKLAIFKRPAKHHVHRIMGSSGTTRIHTGILEQPAKDSVACRIQRIHIRTIVQRHAMNPSQSSSTLILLLQSDLIIKNVFLDLDMLKSTSEEMNANALA